MDLFIGIDISTQSSKLLFINYETIETLFLDLVNYDKDLPHYNTENGTRKNAGFGVSESNPDMWIEAIHILFDRLKKEMSDFLKDVKMISISGQQHGLVTITASGELSRPYSKLWNDFSTGEECEILTAIIGSPENMIKEVGNTQRTGYTAPKILHMVRNEPNYYKNTTTIFLVHNFINWFLTGGKKTGISAWEPGDASGSALWNPITKNWSKNVINAISPDLFGKLPPVKNSREAIGVIGDEFVDKYGFSKDCMIASGSGDNMMGAIGTGNYKEGVVTISLGTSGTAYTFMKEAYVDPNGEIACFCDATGNYLSLLCISNLSNGYEAILKQYKITHDKFEKIICETNPGNRGRILIPWYVGERTPDLPEAAPIYFGFGLNDYTKENLCRAVLEGHIMNLYEGFLKLPVKPVEIRLTGGISKSEVWRYTIANVFNCDVVPVLGEGAVLGAALHAAWTYFKEKTINDIADPFVLIDEKLRIKPDPKIVKVYDDFKPIYLSVSKRIRGMKSENPFKLCKNFMEKYGDNKSK